MANEPKDGGHAFPTSPKGQDGQFSYASVYGGMSLRDYAAIKFEAAMLASPELMEIVSSGSILDGTTAQRVAKRALEYADAFLAARVLPTTEQER